MSFRVCNSECFQSSQNSMYTRCSPYVTEEQLINFVAQKVPQRVESEVVPFSNEELQELLHVQAEWNNQPFKLDQRVIREVYDTYLDDCGSEIADDTLLTAAQLIVKFILRYPELNNDYYLTGIRVASFLVAQKIVNDYYCNNRSIAYILRLDTEKLNELESLFLKGVNWDVSVQKPLYNIPLYI